MEIVQTLLLNLELNVMIVMKHVLLVLPSQIA